MTATVAVALALSPPLAAANGAWTTTPEAKVRLISGWSSAPASEVDLDLGLEFELAPGWHVYWKNSGDAGYAPKLDLSATTDLTSVELLFPAPHRFDLPGGLVSFGYEKAVVYPISGRWHGESGKTLHLRGKLDYLVCADECIPYTAALELLIPAAESGASSDDPESTERLDQFRRQLPREPSETPDAPAISLQAEASSPPFSTLILSAEGGEVRLPAPDLFFETHPFYAIGKPELSLGASSVRFRVPIRPLDETKPSRSTTEFHWTLTGLEGEDGPFALAGRATVALPGPRASRRATWIALVVALLVATALAFRLRRNRSIHPRP